ncbi:BTB/POZ and MATH domain-containing protein 1-like [Phragmites australis]|uniref:BTB/POZ and MATH domain-containing protein 1-like n=1 Tax=Phragmites australis TaxID=29695 RepID=UPI002D7665DA|nr:BTB/POZ and MATH domain-containing protein 1-like [Phragmites australis]XP_062195125.1 BTB/POZ and MATH domain-containing protein 1-like [Phragmites australis]
MGSGSKKTKSSHTTEAEQGTHVFKIVGYTHKKGIGVGKFIQSGIFTVGGYDWAIRFCPDGITEATKQYASVSLVLMSKKAEVRASYGLSLVNQTTGLPESVCSETTTRVFNSSHASCSSTMTLVTRGSKLELKSAGYIVDNCLTIECNVTVVKESQVSKTTAVLEIQVPPSDLSEHFGKLLEEEEGADVTFSVGGETFPAHKIVLSTRSPVFRAELYGKMKERRAWLVTVEDMQPDVFKALLHFIYTDSLPDWDDLDDNDYFEINRHLLVAADRYAMDRLKLLCASILVDYLAVENVATTLALADQHNCDRLKEVCIEFMASSGKMDAVVTTQGYANLKRTCPSILVDVLEKTSRYRKT